MKTRTRTKTRIASVIIVLAMLMLSLGGVMFSGGFSTSASAANAMPTDKLIKLTSSTPSVKVGDTSEFTITATAINNAPDLGIMGAEFYVKFDAAQIDYVSTTFIGEMAKYASTSVKQIANGVLKVIPCAETYVNGASIGLAAMKFKMKSTATAGTKTFGFNEPSLWTGKDGDLTGVREETTTVTVQALDTEAKITSVTVAGATITGSAPNWTGTLPYNANPSVTISPQFTGKSVTVNGSANRTVSVPAGETKEFTMVVTAEDGVTKSQNYKLTLTRASGDASNSLSSLKAYNGTTELAMTESAQTYTVTDRIAYAARGNVKLKLDKGSALAKIDVKVNNVSKQSNWDGGEVELGALNAGANTVDITVKSQTGVENKYKVIMNVVAADTSKGLSELYLQGSDGNPVLMNPQFDPSVLNYSVSVKAGTSLTVYAKAASANAKVEGAGAVQIPGTARIKVTAQNGDVTEYNVVVTVQQDTSGALLSSLSIEGAKNSDATETLELSPRFDKNVMRYEVRIPFIKDFNKIRIRAACENPDYSVQGAVEADITKGSVKTFDVYTGQYAQSDKGNVFVQALKYTITVIYDTEAVAIDTLEITNVGGFTFNPTQSQYKLKLDKSVGKLEFNIDIGAASELYNVVIIGNDDPKSSLVTVNLVSKSSGRTERTVYFELERAAESPIIWIVICSVLGLIVVGLGVTLILTVKRSRAAVYLDDGKRKSGAATRGNSLKDLNKSRGDYGADGTQPDGEEKLPRSPLVDPIHRYRDDDQDRLN